MADPVSIDPNYEFNCPQFLDFEVPMDEYGGEETDNIFESGRVVGEFYPPTEDDISLDDAAYSPDDRDVVKDAFCTPATSQRVTRSTSKKDLAASIISEAPATPVACLAAEIEAAASPIDQGDSLKTTGHAPSNLVTDINTWRAKPTIKTYSHKGRLHGNTTKGHKDPECSTKQKHADDSTLPNSLGNHCANKKPAVAKPLRRSMDRDGKDNTEQRHRRTRTLSHDNGSQSGRRLRARSGPSPAPKPVVAAPKAQRVKLTLPSTPTFMKKKPVGSTTGDKKTTEQLQFEEIQNYRKKLVEKRKLAEQSHKLVQASKGYAPVRSQQPLTQTEVFRFATDGRIKDQSHHSMTTRNGGSQEFTAQLRNSRPLSPAQSHNKPHVTVPQPFHLHENKKRKQTDSEHNGAKKFKSMAEVAMSFATKTPDRFHLRSRKDSTPSKRLRSKSREVKLTVPKTPQFAEIRKRPVTVISQAEKEAMEEEEVKKFQFKAHPVNEKIFKNPNLGVKKVQAKPVTEIQEFDLDSNRRTRAKDKSVEEEPHFEFHAQPVPKSMLNKPLGLKPIKAFPLTIPESPALTAKNRIRAKVANSVAHDEPKVEKEMRAAREHPVPHQCIPFKPRIENRITELKPFSFDEKDRERYAKKEKQITKVFEDEKKKRDFHAQPVPAFDHVSLPKVEKKPATNPEPFHLHIDARGAIRAEQWSQQVEEELRQQRANTNFKAHPPTVIHQPPFVPHRSTKPLTDISEIELNTERRAEDRHDFEVFKKNKELEAMEIKHERERQQEEAEQREASRLRKEAVHKANPIKKYRPVEIKPSDKEPTRPETPRFSDRLKSRSVRC